MSVVDQSVEVLRNRELVNIAQEQGVEVATFALLDQQPSGFVLEGTENSPNPPMLTTPVARRILTKSAYIVPSKTEKEKQTYGPYRRVPIEYVAATDVIESDKIDPSLRNPNTDFIEFRQGMKVVVGEGVNLNLLRFMRKDSRNQTNPDRIPGVEAVYKEMFPEREKEKDISKELLLGEAMAYLRKSFILGETKKGYQYDENRLLAFCRLFDVAADTAAGRMIAMVETAKADPVQFMKKAQLFEERINLQIAHAEQLNVIRINATNIEYVNKEKILTTFSNTLSKDDKVKQLASFFMSKEGREEYDIFQTELEFKSNESLSTN